MTQAFSPAEVLHAKAGTIPSFVIEAVNDLLSMRFTAGPCVIRQDEVIAAAMRIAMRETDAIARSAFFSNHWLDFEPIYQARGWKVTYDKPGFNESYEPSWTFEPDTKADVLDRQLVQI